MPESPTRHREVPARSQVGFGEGVDGGGSDARVGGVVEVLDSYRCKAHGLSVALHSRTRPAGKDLLTLGGPAGAG